MNNHNGAGLSLMKFLIFLFISNAHGAGVSIITHGLNGDANGWVTGMANQIPNYPGFPGTSHSFYRLYFINMGGGYFQMASSRSGGSAPSSTDSGEIIVALDWAPLADGNSFNTYQVAGLVSSALQDPSLISEMNGHALCELPIHLIGHSRGGSLMSEVSLRLGTNGIWVDHLTTLDPHPLNDPAFTWDSVLYSAVDAPARTYQNVLFHDNYWQHLDFFVYGQSVPGAYVRELFSLSGGYSSTHSDAHLWYHATVDQRTTVNDTEAQLNRVGSTWYTAYEDSGLNAGFKWSRIGGGDRTSPDQPFGAGSPAIRDGFNQTWDLGASQSGNRTALPSNNGDWPSLIKFNLASADLAPQGTAISVGYVYQWARSAASAATVSLYIDDDFNPYNSNSRLLDQRTVPGNGASYVSSQTLSIELTAANAAVGQHALYAKISDGAKTRYLYAPDLLTVMPPAPAPILNGARDGANLVLFWTTSAPGYTLQWSTNLPAENWSNAMPDPAIVNGQYTVTNSMEEESVFYRLKK